MNPYDNLPPGDWRSVLNTIINNLQLGQLTLADINQIVNPHWREASALELRNWSWILSIRTMTQA